MNKEEYIKTLISALNNKYKDYFSNKNKETVLNQTFIRTHFNNNLLNFKAIDEDLERFNDKPKKETGIWASTRNFNTAFVSFWDEFISNKNMQSGNFVSTFKIKNTSRILIVDNYSDLAILYFLYPDLEKTKSISNIFHAYNFAEGIQNYFSDTFVPIDWNKVFKDYDVFYFGHKINKNNCTINLDTYNVEQIMIRNIHFIYDIETLSYKKYKKKFCTKLSKKYFYNETFFDYKLKHKDLQKQEIL